jgi:hypothetical protein
MKYPNLRVIPKSILAFLAVTVICAVFFSFPASAEEWTKDLTVGVNGDATYNISQANESSGTITISNGTLTVTGSANNVVYDLNVIMGPNSRLVWNADVTTSHIVNISGQDSGSSITINGGISSSDANPSLNITANAATITITGYVSNSGSSNAIYINSANANVTFDTAGITATNGSAAAVNIYAANSVNIQESAIQCSTGLGTANVGNALVLGTITNGTTITSGVISNISQTNPAILSTSNLTVNGGSITSSKNTAIRQEGRTLTVRGGTITGGDNGPGNSDGVYGISIDNGTIILSGGTITSTSTDEANKADAAVYINYSTATIAGSNIDGGKVYGVKVNNVNSTVTMTDGDLTGNHGIYVTSANTVSISGGKITSKSNNSDDAAVHFSRVNTGTITGDVEIDGGNAVGVDIHDSDSPTTRINFTMSGGTVKGLIGLNLVSFYSANITGGTITGTGTDIDQAAISIGLLDNPYWENPYTSAVTISGDVVVNGGSYGIHVDSPYVASTVTATGGTISGANGYGVFIEEGTFNVYPNAATPVTIRGYWKAIDHRSLGTLDVNNISHYETSSNYDGTASTVYDHATYVFQNSGAYRYIVFYNGAPSYNLTVIGGTSSTGATPMRVQGGTSVTVSSPTGTGTFLGWNASGITLTNPAEASQTFTMPFNDVTITANFEIPVIPEPPANTPDSDMPANSPPSDSNYNPPIPNRNPTPIPSATRPEYIIVIATLNPSGSVNSTETSEDVYDAHRTAISQGVSKILLKIPEGGTGISASTMKKVFKAADGTGLYLSFEYYGTEIDEKTEEEITKVIGNVFLRLSENSPQILTGIDFDSARIDYAKSYAEKRWKGNTVLGIFETAQKGGWVSTAKVSVSLEELGFSADDGEHLYALIYDTKTNKWYQALAIVDDGQIVVNTKRSGVYVIVTDSIL